MKNSRSSKNLLTEINMVPFIDIVLVLLIIFMIMSPFLAQSQIAVNLPQSATSTPSPEDTPIKIQITREGSYYLQNRRVEKNNLYERLRTALLKSRQRAVLIEADKDVPFDHVVFALDAAEQLEAAKVGVAVKPPS